MCNVQYQKPCSSVPKLWLKFTEAFKGTADNKNSIEKHLLPSTQIYLYYIYIHTCIHIYIHIHIYIYIQQGNKMIISDCAIVGSNTI